MLSLPHLFIIKSLGLAPLIKFFKYEMFGNKVGTTWKGPNSEFFKLDILL